ncbi:MAG: hypothetical protein ACRDOS_17700 [Gaiellaceae bacterium]
MQIGADPPTSAGASPGAPGGGIPLWPVVGAAMAALGGLGAGASLIRRRRSERVAG